MRNLVQAVSRLERYAERAEVIDENNYQGYILRLYADGRTRVAYPQYDELHRPFKTDYHLKSVRNLSLGVQQVRGLLVGDNVIDDNNYRGTIDKLYADGRAQVAYPQYSNGSYYKTDYHLKNVLQLHKIYSVER